MAGYLIADIEITDPEGYREYIKAIAGSVARYGGSPIVNTGDFAFVEGETTRNLQVVLRFPSVEDALRWYNSPEYAPAIPLRTRSSKGTLVFVEGAD